jgi:hypothetical protein
MVKKIENEADVEVSSNLEEGRLETIRRRAYELYVARGREEGHDLEDWLLAQAESEVLTTSTAKQQGE